MKFFVAFLFLAVLTGLSTAEPPSRFRTRFFARQEAAPGAEAEATTPPPEAESPAPAPSGPYPPSGWKPAGRALELPTEAKASPPTTSYGTPSTVYGAPTTPPSATDAEANPEPESEAVEPVQPEEAAPDASGRLRQRPQKLTAATVQQGDLYLLVPDLGLQRVQLVPAQRQNAKIARLTQAPQPVFILNP